MTGLKRHFFRHEYSRLVSTLSCKYGIQHVQDVEDAVQSALLKATESWITAELPTNPSAWLYRVAQNHLLETLRQRTNRLRILDQYADLAPPEPYPEGLGDLGVNDDLLRMLFVCCNPDIPQESQLVFALKILCGFEVREISHRLFISEANVYKRLSRARNQLRKNPSCIDELTPRQYTPRLSTVNRVLYVLFTEGYLSSHNNKAIREELCFEAIRLNRILCSHPVGQRPETFALMALMVLHYARLESRQDSMGGLLLLEEQNRSEWDQLAIQEGLEWLSKSATGAAFSQYHAEAGIAAEHALAPTYEDTRWDKIVEYYDLLEHVAPSAIHRLNRAVAIAEWRGPSEAISILEQFEPPSWLSGSYLWTTVLADLYLRSGQREKGDRYRDEALKQAPTRQIHNLLNRRLHKYP